MFLVGFFVGMVIMYLIWFIFYKIEIKSRRPKDSK